MALEMFAKGTDVTWKEIEKIPKESFLLVDLRNTASFEYGCIPGAIHMDYYTLKENVPSFKINMSLFTVKREILAEKLQSFWLMKEFMHIICQVAINNGYQRLWGNVALRKLR